MDIKVTTLAGADAGSLTVSDAIFGLDPREDILQRVVRWQLAGRQQGTHKAKGRAEIARTGAKMYKQKGTGRARHGSRSATQFVGGGRPMGPQPRDYTKEMPKKMRRGAIRCALSALARDNQLVFVDSMAIADSKTKEANRILKTLAGDQSKLVLVTGSEEDVKRSVNNLDDARTLNVRYLNIRDLLQFDRVIVPLAALDVIKQIWGQEQKS